MYEHKSQPMVSRHRFALRLGKVMFVTALVVSGTLAIGAWGFRYSHDTDFAHGLHHATWLAMGEHDGMEPSDSFGRIFEAAYLLFVRLTLFSSAAFVVTPIFHRIMHKLHLDDEDG